MPLRALNNLIARRKRRPRRDESPRIGESPARRLRRVCEQCVNGQLAAAELELYGWRREDDCPTLARVLLSALLARRQELEQALAVLPRADRLTDADDALAAQLLVSLFVATGLKDAAAHVLHRLHHDTGHLPTVRNWIQLMQMPGSAELGEPDAKVDQLATQLLERPQVIASLVAAQRIKAHAEDIDLLRHTLARMFRHITDEQVVMTTIKALAQLSLMAGAEDDARRWAHRGLKMNPFAAEFALVLAEVPDDDAVGEPAVRVLDRVSLAHLTYPDVRRALIEVEYTAGRTASAYARLNQWLREQPDHPIAAELSQRMAA